MLLGFFFRDLDMINSGASPRPGFGGVGLAESPIRFAPTVVAPGRCARRLPGHSHRRPAASRRLADYRP